MAAVFVSLNLKFLSTRFFQERPRKRARTSSDAGSNGGAIIESMHHHGKGVYSGTFSGTLKLSLQDRSGQPKRDITTIIHILNDLLCAQYKNYSTSASAASSSSSSMPRTSRSSASATSGPSFSSKSTSTNDIHSSKQFGKKGRLVIFLVSLLS